MRISKYVLFSVILLSTAFASSRIAFHHDIPQGIVRGEQVTFELMMPSSANRLYDMHLFYRQLGEGEYSFVRMEREGFLYQVTLGTENFTVGQVEYYFAYEGRLGEIGSLPQESPEQNPFVMHVAPARVKAQEYSVEVVILSPEPDEVVRGDSVIAASILGTDTEFDVSKTKLMIDGKNVTNLAEINDGVLTFSPPQIVGGFHNVELIVFDSGNAQVGKQEWSFRATGGAQQGVGGSNYKGSFFIEDRNQDIQSSNLSNNYFRAGVQLAGNIDAIDWRTRLIYSSEESDNRQPVNRYGVHGRYKFSQRNNVYLRGGDFTPFYSPLTFQSKRVRGIGAGLEMGFFTFDFIWGQLKRGIEGAQRVEQLISGTDTSNVNVPFGGTHSENVLALRPGFRFGNSVHWHLNLVNSKEDAESIEFGGNVKEALVVGTDLNMNFDNKRILFDADFQASIGNSNATGEEITFDTLASRYSGLGSSEESAYNFLESTGFLSMTEGLTPFPSLAMRFETTLRYFNNNLQVRYLRIDENFRSPGNPYMLKDVSGLYIIDNFRLLKNQIFVNLFYKAFTNSRSKDNFATDNNEIGASISYFPLENIPSLTVSFNNISRSNKVTEADNEDYDNPLLFKEDNTTSSITVSSSYNVNMSSVRNTLSLSFTNYNRDESAELRKESNSDFSVFSAGVKSRFDFPLTAQFNFSTSSSAFGDTSQSKNDISRINFGVDYLFRDVVGGGNLKPFAFFTFQNIKTEIPVIGDISSTRNNYTFGLSYRSAQYGILTVRYDSISYSELDVSDSILNAKYQYNF